jgi:hypothetical protein
MMMPSSFQGSIFFFFVPCLAGGDRIEILQ